MEIKNRLMSFLFNRLDAPIRLIYSRLHLNNLFFWKMYSSNFEKLDRLFEKIKQLLADNHYSFENKICLELGPGNTYINAYNFLLNGAKKVILVDKYPRYSNRKKQQEYIRKELAYIQNKYQVEELPFIKEGEIDAYYIKFIASDLTEANIRERVDFACSISVLEHIRDIEANIKKLSQIVKKGGLIYHAIDLRDHYNFNNPFLFLKYSKKAWEKYLTKEGVSYTNRVRCSEFRDIFKKYKLEIINEEVKRFSLNNVAISQEFDKSYKDLDVGIYNVLLIKTG